MRVLLVGSGGREHALAMAIARSPKLTELYIAPGNPGTAQFGKNVNIASDNIIELVKFAQKKHIDLVVPGPELPLIEGLTDSCNLAGIACAGPTQKAAQLEGSKSFTKSICNAAHIPTAQWQEFTDIDSALAYVQKQKFPLVIKADGLAAGKGVVIAYNIEETQNILTEMMIKDHFGKAGKKVVIEEFLEGEEVSLFAFCDGEDAILMGAAQDHKRIGDNDTGPNTGGMGAVSPPPFFGEKAQQHALELTIRPMLKEMNRRGIPFRGIIFAGLMLTQTGIYLIEYNIRFGDPEAEVLLPRLRSDLLTILYRLSQGKLIETKIEFSKQVALCVVMAAKNYPGTPITGGIIKHIDKAENYPNVKVFQAGTMLNDSHELCAAGGRVLCVTALHDSLKKAKEIAYLAIKEIDWKDAIWRTDIGKKALDYISNKTCEP